MGPETEWGHGPDDDALVNWMISVIGESWGGDIFRGVLRLFLSLFTVIVVMVHVEMILEKLPERNIMMLQCGILEELP